MKERDQAYLNGVDDTLKEVNKRLNASIKRNNGARTAGDVVRVFNDVVTNLHMMQLDYLEVVEVDKRHEEESVILVFTNLGGVVQ